MSVFHAEFFCFELHPAAGVPRFIYYMANLTYVMNLFQWRTLFFFPFFFFFSSLFLFGSQNTDREQAAADKKAAEAEAAALREKESAVKPAARWPEVQAVEDSVINMKPLCELSIVRTDPAGKFQEFLKDCFLVQSVSNLTIFQLFFHWIPHTHNRV